jgi:hypothetical protein
MADKVVINLATVLEDADEQLRERIAADAYDLERVS